MLVMIIIQFLLILILQQLSNKITTIIAATTSQTTYQHHTTNSNNIYTVAATSFTGTTDNVLVVGDTPTTIVVGVSATTSTLSVTPSSHKNTYNVKNSNKTYTQSTYAKKIQKLTEIVLVPSTKSIEVTQRMLSKFVPVTSQHLESLATSSLGITTILKTSVQEPTSSKDTSFGLTASLIKPVPKQHTTTIPNVKKTSNSILTPSFVSVSQKTSKVQLAPTTSTKMKQIHSSTKEKKPETLKTSSSKPTEESIKPSKHEVSKSSLQLPYSILARLRNASLFLNLTLLNCSLPYNASWYANETLYNMTYQTLCFAPPEKPPGPPWYEDENIYFIGGGAVVGLILLFILKTICGYCSKYSGEHMFPRWKIPRRKRGIDAWTLRQLDNMPTIQDVEPPAEFKVPT